MEREVFFCENNVSKGLDEIIERLSNKYPELTINVEDCLGHCGDCAEILYAVIDAEMITAEDADELYDKIADKLEE